MKIPTFQSVASILMSLVGICHAADVELLQSTIVDSNALNFSSTAATFNRNINGRTYQRFPMVTSHGYQYAIYYDDNRNVCVGRRKLPGGTWDVIRFTDYNITSHDSHNVAAIGICEKDGTIHLAFDHHKDPLNYRVSALGAASDPESVTWSTSLFGPITSSLGSAGNIVDLTYPTFFNAPNGNLMLYYRLGGSGNGDGMIQEYNGTTRDWTTGLGKFISRNGTYNGAVSVNSTSRNPYINGISYAGNRLHVSWGWRESSTTATSNHDLNYAYSDDNGRTWRNSAGAIIGVTGSSFITLNSTGLIVALIPENSGLSNQYTHYAFPDGSCHVMVIHGGKYQHYWRNAAGSWSQGTLSFSGSRPKLTGDDDGNLFLAYVSGGNPRIAKGVPNGGQTAWTWSSVYTQNDTTEDGEGQIDYSRWQTERVLSFYGQESPTSSGEVPSPLHVFDYKVSNKASRPGPAHEALHVSTIPVLGWEGGIAASTCRIYFSTDSNAVATATTASPEYMGEQAGTSYAPSGTLAEGTTYFWRIDTVEAGGAVHQGLVWSFTTSRVLPQTTEVIAGWDIWNSATSPVASTLAQNITGSAVTTTQQDAWNTTDDRGASNDGTWGTFSGPPAASINVVSGENLTLPNATTGGTITFTVVNNGTADIVLNSFHFDAYAFRPKAPRTYELSVLAGGGVSAGSVFASAPGAITSVGGANSNSAHDDIDIDLTGLADHILGAGESVDLLLAFSGGAGDASGGHHLFVDNAALSGSMAGGGPGNQAPAFTSDPVVEANADEGVSYSNSIADNATDPESDPMTFSKISGPAWLNVAANGALSGIPGAGDVGLNSFTVQVNATGGSDTATLEIAVIAAPVNQPPSFTSDPVVEANSEEGLAYSSSIADNATDPESDPMTFSKISGPAWLNVAANGALSGIPGAGDIGLNSFTVQVNAAGGSDTATLEITVDPAAGPVADYALNESTALGSVAAGSISDAMYSDNVYEVLTEAQTGGNPSNRRSQLEHTWTFNVLGGELVTFYVEAHHSANTEGDDFTFSYSTDNINFTDMVTVTKTADENTAQFYSLPGDLSGIVYVKVVDTNRMQGNGSTDSLYVDTLMITSEAASAPPDVAANPDPGNGATGVAMAPTLTWTAGMLTSTHDIYFGTNPNPGPAEFQGNQSGTSFSPGTLTASTTYYWAVDEVNSVGTTLGQIWSFTTGSGASEMHVSSIVLGTQKSGKSYRGVATVTIVDSGTGQPVSGAVVSGSFTGAFSESGMATTNASGEAVIATGARIPLPFSFTFTVTGVTASGYAYNPANNVETSDSGSF